MPILRLAALVLASFLVATSARAAEEPGSRVHAKTGKYEDVRDDLKDAIINRGFVIDHVGDLSAMLERTAEAVENAKSPYLKAEFLQFCPLRLTHEAAAASPLAIANCPVAIFVYEAASAPGEVLVGYRLPPATTSSALRQINEKLTALLNEIAQEAVKK